MFSRQLAAELITDFHNQEIPEFIPRAFDFSAPKNKIRCLIGIRRAGKTFCFFQLIDELLKNKIEKERIIFINFEDERLLPLDISSLSSILNTYYEIYPSFKDIKVYVFFDEIQNVSGWERFVRRIHDNENVQINLTGSSSRLMSKEIATSLRGRTMAYEISPLNFNEYLRFKNISRDYHSSKGKAYIIHAFNSYINKGGFPEVLGCSETFRLKILQDYFNLILYKDLIERYKIRNHSLLKYLLKFLFSNNANPFSVNKFYRDSKSQGYVSSKDSLHNYLSYLEDAFCFSFVPIFSDSIRKQQVNYKKIYAVDHGLVTGMVSSSSYNTGRLLETMVHNQLRRHYSKEEIFYYRTSQKKEIDFLVYKLGNIHTLIQVAETITKPETRKRETASLYQALKELNIKDAKIITGYEEELIKEDSYTIQVLPFWKWALLPDFVS